MLSAQLGTIVAYFVVKTFQANIHLQFIHVVGKAQTLSSFKVSLCKLLPFCCSKYISEHILIFIIECRSLSKTLQQCETAKVLKTSQYCENALKSRVDDGVGYSVGHWVINGVVCRGDGRGFGHGVGHCVLHGVSLF